MNYVYEPGKELMNEGIDEEHKDWEMHTLTFFWSGTFLHSDSNELSQY